MSQQRILVTGASGQVGTELLRATWPANMAVKGVASADLDITDRDAVFEVIEHCNPDFVVNAAAYTAVDDAEANPDRASAVNCDGARHLCEAASAVQARVLHLSTDYVFDGTSKARYSEGDEPSPLGVYGTTKRAGELEVLAFPGNVVVRTSWVYSAHRSNFVLTIRKIAAGGGPIRVVADQYGCPTSAQDLSRALIAAISQGLTWPGLFHLAAPDDATWFDLAAEAVSQMDLADMSLIDQVEIVPITTAEYPTAAARPHNSRLSSARFNETYGIALLPWRKALATVSAELNSLAELAETVVTSETSPG